MFRRVSWTCAGQQAEGDEGRKCNGRSTEAAPQTPFLDRQPALLVCLWPSVAASMREGPAVTAVSPGFCVWLEDHTQRPGSLLDKHAYVANFFFLAFNSLTVGSPLQHIGPSLRRAGPFVEARGLSSPGACGLLPPQPGIRPVSPALEDRFLTTHPSGKCQTFFLISSFKN